MLTSYFPATQEKKPNVELLQRATRQKKWKVFQERKPTSEEGFIFSESSHLATVTGAISGITVIDLDGSAAEELKEEGMTFPDVPTVRTQSGGWHLYFAYDEQIPTTQKLGAGKNIDIRNDGAYVISKGNGYEWITPLDESTLQPVPNWVHEKVQESRYKQQKHKGGGKVSSGLNEAHTRARELNMSVILNLKGYSVDDEKLFSCILDDHNDENPSAQIVTNSKGEHRYVCYSHEGGKLNLSTIDVIAKLDGLSIKDATQEALSFIGESYYESEFHRAQRDKYHFNTYTISELSYIQENFPNLYTYLNRYEVELRALMDYAEANLKGDMFSHDGEAIFYMPKRYAAKMFSRWKHTKTINTVKAQNVLKLLSLLGLIHRVPSQDVSEEAKAFTKNFSHIIDGERVKEVNFFSFHWFTDSTLSRAEDIAAKLKASKFKIDTLRKDVIYHLFDEQTAQLVFPDQRKVSTSYENYKTEYTRVIMKEVQRKGYTTKQEAVAYISTQTSKRNKEYHFDKVINDICESYDLLFSFATKEIKTRFNIEGRGRQRIIYPE